MPEPEKTLIEVTVEKRLRVCKEIKATEEEIESLEEASALEDIAHMPARVKCAVLGWHTMEEMLKCDKCSGHGECSHCN